MNIQTPSDEEFIEKLTNIAYGDYLFEMSMNLDIDEIMQLIHQRERALIEHIRSSLPKKVKATYIPEMGVYVNPSGTPDSRWNEALDDVTAVLTVIEEEMK